ncbi:DedA family protein [Gordonia desulfuricans]|uniref:DedA family protein n=1 Tax=Gordonia desulfuricans TaxID=89051 RepID=A0A7K3LUI6_9ACTN|nr:DedA family protein [Gordonia desulfuricans]NDK91948.1 DedA family protein [Gordonia desulfuricans]
MNPFDIDSFLATGGLIGLCVLIFVETGLLIGFVFPGDSVLFTAGVLAAQPNPFAEVWWLCILVPLAAILGDQCGYFIGRRVGRSVIEGRMRRAVGPEYVERTHRFFERYGPLTVFFGRFIGVVRTLTPLFAGFSGMPYRVFTLFSVLGSFVWAAGIVMLGYFLGQVPLIRDHLEVFIIASVLTVVVPMGIAMGRRWLRSRREADRRETGRRETDGDTSADPGDHSDPDDASAVSGPEPTADDAGRHRD